MVCLGNFVAQYGGLGTDKMVCLRNLWFIVRLFRHRNDGVPKKLCGSER